MTSKGENNGSKKLNYLAVGEEEYKLQ